MRAWRGSISVALMASAATARAQGGAADSTRPVALLTRRDLAIGSAAVAATLALLPADRALAEEFRDPGPQRSSLLRSGARVFNRVGDPGTLVASVAAFGAGELIHSPRLTDLGLHTTEAIVLSGAATGLLKGALGRQRPFVDERDGDDFAFGRGFGNGSRASLPSGHATAAFAAAAAIMEETRHWWPHAPRVVGPVLYGGAAAVGLARMYDDKHWASDVVLGAGIGSLSGLSVVRYNHERPRTWVDLRLGLASIVPTVAPLPRGRALVWQLTTR